MKYVVIGSSAAGINAVKELRRLDKDSEIVLISKDKDIYSRCILHHYMEGIRSLEELNFAEGNFADLYQVNWMKGCEVTSVKPSEKVVVLADGTNVAYDKLLIASGSHTFVPPIPNLKEANNVIGFRNIEDIEVLKEAAKTHKNFLIMGAGLVGIDCVSGLLSSGVNVTLVEMAGWMLSKQLDERAAKTYQDAFAAKGVAQYYGDGIKETKLDENGNICAMVLNSGTEIACDYVVVTAGVRANVEFLADSGIETSRFGLVYDETGKNIVYDSQGNAITATTNDKGIAIFTDIPYGKYTIKETTAPTGYILSNTPLKVEIKENGKTIDVGSVGNKIIKGNIQITKVDAEDDKKFLSGAVFT
ncbi:MAG: FAD-dependent oxidoreductase, partial [Longicatena sp.]|nr:FAD-dependent oxidoreductase [Longicatena sp.]